MLQPGCLLTLLPIRQAHSCFRAFTLNVPSTNTTLPPDYSRLTPSYYSDFSSNITSSKSFPWPPKIATDLLINLHSFHCLHNTFLTFFLLFSFIFFSLPSFLPSFLSSVHPSFLSFFLSFLLFFFLLFISFFLFLSFCLSPQIEWEL